MKITDQIHLIKHPFLIPVSPEMQLERFVFSLILFGEQITLIDSGVRGSQDKLFNYIRENGRKEGEIKTLILSHSHPDHIGSAAEIKAQTGCTLMAHEGEKEWIENIDLQNQERPVPGFYNLVDRSVKIDCLLEDGDDIDAGTDLNIQVIHTPGHSKGSVSLFFPYQKILFTADAVPLAGDIPNYDSYTELKASLNKIRQLTSAEILLSSWADPAIGQEQIQNQIERGEAYIDTLHEAVLKYYASPDKTNFENCTRLITGLGLPPAFINPLAHRAFLSHFRTT
jgi:hydroxyacylglutathione hydrolase